MLLALPTGAEVTLNKRAITMTNLILRARRFVQGFAVGIALTVLPLTATSIGVQAASAASVSSSVEVCDRD